MKFQIEHLTEYSFSHKVFFEPHYLRFKPKDSPHSSLISFKAEIDPKPTGFAEQFDIENNHIMLCWFDETHKNLKISIKTEIEVAEYNPFNFLIYPSEYLKIPFDYNYQTKQLLMPALQHGTLPKQMNRFFTDVLNKSDAQTISFLTELTSQIHRQFVLETREFGEPLEPEHTYQKKIGSCRDLAWMQIHLLRNLGIASRFVSGYFYLDSDNPEFELHAWVEVFLPGAGWIGFDPSHGLIAGCYHIPLASSAFYGNTMPVSGSIRGTAESKMKNELKISLIS